MNKNKKSLLIKIIIPLAIVAVLATMWMIKNKSDDEGTSDDINITEPNLFEGADFSLTSTKAIDVQDLTTKYGLPIIVDYGSEGCMPCQEMKPALKRVNERMYQKAFVKYIDVWEYPDAAGKLPVNLIPTQVFWNADGTPWIPSDRLQEKIGFDVYYNQETNEPMYTLHVSPLTESEMLAILVEMGVDVYD